MTHYELNLPTPIGALPIIVERKRVRNFNLRVRADGSVRLSMPLRARLSDAEDFLMRRRDWIASHVQAHRERARVASMAENDDRIPLWGELVAYPPACLDFVITHELVHLMEPSHNKRFHMLLDCYCPESRALAALLRTNARTVAMGQAHT